MVVVVVVVGWWFRPNILSHHRAVTIRALKIAKGDYEVNFSSLKKGNVLYEADLQFSPFSQPIYSTVDKFLLKYCVRTADPILEISTKISRVGQSPSQT